MSCKIEKDIISQILNLYQNGVGTMEISSKFGISKFSVRKYLLQNNIILRKTSAYKNSYNINYFSEYTIDNCYWAGFISADGCISGKSRLIIKLAALDEKHLHKLCIAMNRNLNLIKQKNGQFTFYVSGEKIINDLYYNFDISNRKTFTSAFPSKMPEIYWKHFIRGLLDGDGCITFTSCPSIKFTASIGMLDTLRVIFYDKLSVRLRQKNLYPPIITISENKLVGEISYSGKNAKLILDWLFSDSENNNRLERKYNKYLELF